MDFLSIRKKARERAEAKEAGGAEPRPGASGAPAEPEKPPGPPPQAEGEPPLRERRHHERRAQPAVPPEVEQRRGRGDERVLTDTDLAEGALQARLQDLAPSADGRFATWRPGSGPPPVEPDPFGFDEPRGPTVGVPGAAALPEPALDASPEPAPESAGVAPSRAAEASSSAAQEDPLDAFFFRPDEEAAAVPLMGSPLKEEPVPAAPTALDEFLTFTLDKEEFAVPIDRVREVMRAPTITEVPRAPAHVMGVVALRGEVVPVIDAHLRLGLGRSSGAQGRIVIVDAGEGPLGLVVDAVSSVVRLPRGAIEPCPQGISAADCVTGIGRWRDRLFMVVDVGLLLGRARPAEAR